MAKRKPKPTENLPVPATSPPKKPQRTGRAVNVWVSTTHAAAFDAFLEKHGRLPPTITSIVELALEEFFRREGVWPQKEK